MRLRIYGPWIRSLNFLWPLEMRLRILRLSRPTRTRTATARQLAWRTRTPSPNDQTGVRVVRSPEPGALQIEVSSCCSFSGGITPLRALRDSAMKLDSDSFCDEARTDSGARLSHGPSCNNQVAGSPVARVVTIVICSGSPAVISRVVTVLTETSHPSIFLRLNPITSWGPILQSLAFAVCSIISTCSLAI
jgi:hypothetical protein